MDFINHLLSFNVPALFVAIPISLFLILLALYFVSVSKLKRCRYDRGEEQRKRDEFSAVMVHELRAPLSVVKGSADVLLEDRKDLPDNQISELLNQIKTSSSGLLNLVNALLDIATIESGKVELFKEPHKLNELLDETYQYYFDLAKERGVNIITSLDDRLGEVGFDRSKIKQVLDNLLSNAVKYTEPGDTVFLSSRLDKGVVIVEVADTGKGITDDAKEKLFNKFVRAQEHKGAKEKGTGLGLVITKGIVEAHGGKIWVEDNSPKGAKFIFTLPV